MCGTDGRLRAGCETCSRSRRDVPDPAQPFPAFPAVQDFILRHSTIALISRWTRRPASGNQSENEASAAVSDPRYDAS